MKLRKIITVVCIGTSIFQSFTAEAVKILFEGREVKEAIETDVLKAGLSRKIDSPGLVVLSEQGLASDTMVRERFSLESITYEQKDIPSYSRNIKPVNPVIKGARFKTEQKADEINYILKGIRPVSQLGSEDSEFKDSFLEEPYEEIVSRQVKSGMIFLENELILHPSVAYVERDLLFTNQRADISDTVWISSEPINVHTNTIVLRNLLTKTPSGVCIRPNTVDSWFEEIRIIPKRFIYKSVRTGEFCQSETCKVSGEIDFRTGIVNLEVLSGYLSITFRPRLLEDTLPSRLDFDRIDLPADGLEALLNKKGTERQLLHEEHIRRALFDEAMLTSKGYFEGKNEHHGPMALFMFQEVIKKDPNQQRRALTFHTMGMIYSKGRKEYENSLGFFQAALDLGSKESLQFLEEAKALYAAQLYQNGIYFRDHPQEDKDFIKAREAFLKSIIFDDKNVKAMDDLAMLFWKMKDYQNADVWFRQAIGLGFEPSSHNLAKMKESMLSSTSEKESSKLSAEPATASFKREENSTHDLLREADELLFALCGGTLPLGSRMGRHF